MVLQDLELGFGKGAAGWLAGVKRVVYLPCLGVCVSVSAIK